MRDKLVFYLNGSRRVAGSDVATSTLSDYLRLGDALGVEDAAGDRLCGTKIACAEGDCGACTVLVGKLSADSERLEYETIDACIALVGQMDLRHVVTVEALAGEDRLAAVQQAMVDNHGSQCGFCTPGFVMALQGLAESKEGAHLDEDQLRLGLSGNLCRCTGYEQILAAGRQIAQQDELDRIDQRFDPSPMIKEFVELTGQSVVVEHPGTSANGRPRKNPTRWAIPADLEQLVAERSQRPNARLIAGATDLGVQLNHGKIAIEDAILTTRVAELDQLEVVDNELVIGAAVSWSRIEAFVKQCLPSYYEVLTRFGSPQIRHAGTLAGNLANASPIADSIPLHYIAGATLELASTRGSRQVDIEDFYQGYKQIDLQPGEVIAGITTPLPTEASKVALYKVSKRRDMDISTVAMAFWIELDGDAVESVRIAAGGVGPTVVRLREAEAALAGAGFTLDAMRAAGAVARTEIKPLTDVRGTADYRLQLVENLFSKCWHELSAETVGA